METLAVEPTRHATPTPAAFANTIPHPPALDVRVLWMCAAGLGLTAVVSLSMLPFRSTAVGTILFDRGITQYLSLFLTCTVFAFVVLKVGRLRVLVRALHRRPDELVLNGTAPRWMLEESCGELVRLGDSVSVRRARALKAFLTSGRRTIAAAQAEQDATLAQTSSEQSYAIPKVMIWAIPLMGFIGTVLGISGAVAGFSGFLQSAEEIEQIKGAIGGVTTGLAVAFDTTLVALALSVIAMLVLVATERFEAHVLNDVEADVNDAIVARLPEGDGSTESEALTGAVKDAIAAQYAKLENAVHEAVRSALPTPEEIVRPAHETLRAAVTDITAGLRTAVGEIGLSVRNVQSFQEEALRQLMATQTEMRQAFRERDQQALAILSDGSRALRSASDEMAAMLQTESARVARTLAEGATEVGSRLEHIGQNLQQRIAELTRLSEHTSEAIALEQSLLRTLRSLEETSDLRSVLSGVRDSLQGLQPTMARLAEPRRILLVESGNGQQPHQ